MVTTQQEERCKRNYSKESTKSNGEIRLKEKTERMKKGNIKRSNVQAKKGGEKRR